MNDRTAQSGRSGKAASGKSARQGRARRSLKGRQVDPKALEEVQALLGDVPRRADLLIEHLHRIQDRYGPLSAPHLAAPARGIRLSLSQGYAVVSVFHHF